MGLGTFLGMTPKEQHSQLRQGISDTTECCEADEEALRDFVTRMKELQLFAYGHNVDPLIDSWKHLQDRISNWPTLRSHLVELSADLVQIRCAPTMDALTNATQTAECKTGFQLISTMLHAIQSREVDRLNRAGEKLAAAKDSFISRLLTTLLWEGKLLAATVCRDVVPLKDLLTHIEEMVEADEVVFNPHLCDTINAAKDMVRKCAKLMLTCPDLHRMHTAIVHGQQMGFSEKKLADAKVRYFDEYLRSTLEDEHIVQWQYDNKGWKDFGYQSCVDFEYGYQMGFADHAPTGVDLKKMEVNRKGNVLKVRRVPPLCIPQHWDGESPIEVTEEARILFKSAQILCAKHVRNVLLWDRYAFFRSQMREAHADLSIVCEPLEGHDHTFYNCDASLNEMYLFHGCSSENAAHIEMMGFSPDCSIHFTSSLMRAMTFSPDRTVIVARVLLGDAYINKEGRNCLQSPESRQGDDVSPYDSVVAPLGDVDDFIVYESMQTYPEFVLMLE